MWINNKDIYLVSESTLKARSLISANVDAAYIVPAIKAAQDIRLVEVLGRDLVNKLCTLVEAGNVTAPYKVLLDNYVTDYLLWQVLAEIQYPLWAKTRNEGVVTTQGSEYSPLSRNDVAALVQHYKDTASGLVPPMVEYCVTNSVTEYKPACHHRGSYNPSNICLA